MTVPRRLAYLLALLMALQAGLGLLFAPLYRDAAWIKATWFGNDWTTLLLAVPLLLLGASRESAIGFLVWMGVLAYALYNDAFYLFGAALNVFFPLYVAILVLAGASLILGLSRAELSTAPPARARLVGGFLMFVAVGLSVVWFGMWGAHVFAGRATPVEPEAFKIVAALDTTLLVPPLFLGGFLLWRRHAWGHLIASIAAIQASLYLLVLSVNSAVAIERQLTAFPGELPVWLGLFVPTAAATAVLLHSARRRMP